MRRAFFRSWRRNCSGVWRIMRVMMRKFTTNISTTGISVVRRKASGFQTVLYVGRL